MKYLVPEKRKCLKNDGDVSKRHRIQLECVCTAQFWGKKMSLKINNDSIGLQPIEKKTGNFELIHSNESIN